MAFTHFTIRDFEGTAQYQTISCLSEYSSLSLEELRLEDYKHGRRGYPTATLKPGVVFENMNKEGHLTSDLYVFIHQISQITKRRTLRGPGIEICVGIPNSSGASAGTHDVWCLPKRLISHFSPFLKAAHERDFKERQESRIELPEDDARVFGLFVQWMYYGAYTMIPAFAQSQQPGDSISIHARCWILGDKLLCTDFKNYAMSHLYAQHASTFPCKPVATQDVEYACDNSVTNSKLRKFYFAFVIEHFANPDRLQGGIEEWDDLLLAHADLRQLLLQNLRMAIEERATVETLVEYFDRKAALAAPAEEHAEKHAEEQMQTATHRSV